MRKLGLCICYLHKNYGSQLQSYATTMILEQMGIEYEILRYKKDLSPKTILMALRRLTNANYIRDRFFLRYQKKLVLSLRPKIRRLNEQRNQKIYEFSNSRFHNLSKICRGYTSLCEKSKEFFAVMVGSDQVWGPGGIDSGFYNLMFAADGVKRISYAASFGVSEIPKSLQPIYHTFLNKMDNISVRENRGKELVEELSENTALVVTDPVMLLTTQEWDKLIPFSRLEEKPYLFAYILGKNKNIRMKIKDFACRKKLTLITIPHMDSYNSADEGFGDRRIYDAGPEEFLNLIRGADFVCTDSFHGSVFSAMYHKPLIIFDRYSDKDKCSRNSRIDSFCKNFDMDCCRYSEYEDLTEPSIDYNSVSESISQERRKSLEYLNMALDI